MILYEAEISSEGIKELHQLHEYDDRRYWFDRETGLPTSDYLLLNEKKAKHLSNEIKLALMAARSLGRKFKFHCIIEVE